MDDTSTPILSPPERSFRPWFAAVLAVVVLALAYVSWRGASTTPASRTAAQVPPPPAAVENPAAAPPAAENPAAPQTASGTSVSPEISTPPAKSPGAAVNSPASPAIESTPSLTTTGKGLEELAQAQDFLNGTNGRERNTLQAAQWLWKAVRKENADATVLLSELYLRGDGVPKSCEQARLLLDAAALKGRKDAAGALQNLTAFGCQ
jgi:type IV secretory pathway VirB10-like protein